MHHRHIISFCCCWCCRISLHRCSAPSTRSKGLGLFFVFASCSARSVEGRVRASGVVHALERSHCRSCPVSVHLPPRGGFCLRISHLFLLSPHSLACTLFPPTPSSSSFFLLLCVLCVRRILSRGRPHKHAHTCWQLLLCCCCCSSLTPSCGRQDQAIPPHPTPPPPPPSLPALLPHRTATDAGRAYIDPERRTEGVPEYVCVCVCNCEPIACGRTLQHVALSLSLL